jgi:uncharacterized OsmC-like protein
MLQTVKATAKKVPGGLTVENEARNFKIIMDEPKDMGGTNKGMNPIEAVLCALGSCQVIVAAAFAKSQNFKFDTDVLATALRETRAKKGKDKRAAAYCRP